MLQIIPTRSPLSRILNRLSPEEEEEEQSLTATLTRLSSKTEKLNRSIDEATQRRAKVEGLRPAIVSGPTNLPLEAAGRVAEFTVGVARQALNIPIGMERIITSAFEGVTGRDDLEESVPSLPGTDMSLQDAARDLESKQEVIREVFGLEESLVSQIAQEVTGALITGKAAFTVGSAFFKSLATKFGGKLFVHAADDTAIAFATRSSRIANKLGRIAGFSAEGALFEGGRDLDNDTKDILMVAAGGAVVGKLGNTFQRLRVNALLSKAGFVKGEFAAGPIARKLLMGEAIESAEVAKFVGQTDYNVSQIMRFVNRADDDLVAGVEVALSATGDTGNLGAVRGLTEVGDNALFELRKTHPNFRFELIEEGGTKTLLYGLNPKARHATGGIIGDFTLNNGSIGMYQKHGFMPGQKVLVDEVEHRVIGPAGKRIRVRPLDGGNSLSVPQNKISLLNQVETPVRAPSLNEVFRDFRADNPRLTVEESLSGFVSSLDDVDDALKPGLRQYLGEQEVLRIVKRMEPADAATLRHFKEALISLRERGLGGQTAIPRAANLPIEELAAARGHAVTRLSANRVVVTDMVTGESVLTGVGDDVAREYLQANRRSLLDITPDLEVAPKELLMGAFFSAPPPNLAIPAEMEVVDAAVREGIKSLGFSKGLTKFWLTNPFSPGRWASNVPELAKNIEVVTDIPIWKEAIGPLHTKLSIARNELEPFAVRLNKAFQGIKPERVRVVETWLTSKNKAGVEKSFNMTRKEIAKARQIRLTNADYFDLISSKTGTRMTHESFYEDWVPDIQQFVAKGVNDPKQIFSSKSQPVPKEFEFWSELFKSGEISSRPQDHLYVKLMRTYQAGLNKTNANVEFKNALKMLETIEDEEVARVLGEYLIGVRGYTDATRQALKRTQSELLRNVGVNMGEADSRLMSDFVLAMQYGGLMGFRYGLVMRNWTQPFNLGAPLLPGNGFAKMAAAQLKAIKNWRSELQWAEKVGVTQRRPPFAQAEEAFEGATAFASKLGRIPQRVGGLFTDISRQGVKAYGSMDNLNRVTSGIAMRDLVKRHAPKFLEGKMSTERFLRKSGISALKQPDKEIILAKLEGPRGSINDAADEAGRAFAEHINFLYGRESAPAWQRTSPGKIFGSFSTWTFGYTNWIKTALNPRNTASRNSFLQASEIASRAAKHGLWNIGIRTLGAQQGINIASWVAWNSLGYSGGPYLNLAVDMGDALGGDKQAWKRVSTTLPRVMFPAATLILRDIPKATNAALEGDSHEALLYLIGIPQIKESRGL